MAIENSELALRLKKLRQRMKKAGADFFFIPSSDAHRSEYVPEKWQRRAWISGFTGSAGDVVVGHEHAWLWTDGRYTQQAQKELDPKLFSTFQTVQGAASAIDIWLAKQSKGTVFALDPSTITAHQAKRFASALDEINGKLSYISPNWIDEFRGEFIEEVHPIFIQELKFTGASVQEKLAKVRAAMKAQNAEVLLLNVLDEIAWLFNLRGSDVSYNPFFISYACVTLDKAELFLDLRKMTPEVKKYLADAKVNVSEYTAFERKLLKLKGNVWLDQNNANAWMYGLVSHAHRVSSASPIIMMKAVKNPVELNGAKEAHIKDAVSMIKFMRWLENNWNGQTELSVAEKLEQVRRENPDCRDLSFGTISGFGPHGSIIHYHSTPESNIPLENNNLFLLDSGGQYWEGTTDITRVFHFGEPTAKHKEWYTRVLKGHLLLRKAIFCDGTRGEHLDVLARLSLWQSYANYGHGTGHGVGSYLCVHEGPQRISTGATTAPLVPGMIVSNEPGVYIEGECGIRIENLIYVVEKATVDQSPTGHGPFYGFEDLTLVPYETKLIDLNLLSQEEVDQINIYHEKIFTLISPLLELEDSAYLKSKTQRV
jgi:Xaa-Pro aminopeptidase